MEEPGDGAITRLFFFMTHHKDQPLSDPPQALATAPFTNLNRVFNNIADEQGVPVGSWDWLLGGPAPWSGSSGEQASYGWRHDHKVNPDYVRSVIANYGHRRTWYESAPWRQYGPPYPPAGRPDGWTPEMPGDNPDGSCTYIAGGKTHIVCGPDVEHFWLNPLFALIDTTPINVNALGQTIRSDQLARIMVTLQLRSLAGQIRKPNSGVQAVPWTFGDRANSRILDTGIQAHKRGTIEAIDATTILKWVDEVMLPFYEQAPGISSFGSAPPDMFPIGCFNGLYWILPVCYEAAKNLPAGSTKDRLEALVTRWSQWALDLEQTVPGQGFNMSRVYVDSKSIHAKLLDSIKPLLKPENIVFDLNWELRTFRACAVAAKVNGAPELVKAWDRVREKYKDEKSLKAWIVDADGNYIS